MWHTLLSEWQRVSKGFRAAFLSGGLQKSVWQLERNREELKNICRGLLSAPLDTQSKELRVRAEIAYQNGWFLPEALEDFLQAEQKNKYDFAVHISIAQYLSIPQKMIRIKH